MIEIRSRLCQLSGRGVAYWTDGRGDERVLYVTTGYRLVELNATIQRQTATIEGLSVRIDSLKKLMAENYDAIFVGSGAPRGRRRHRVRLGGRLLGGSNAQCFKLRDQHTRHIGE